MVGHRWPEERDPPGGTKKPEPVLEPVMSLLVSAAEPMEPSIIYGDCSGHSSHWTRDFSFSISSWEGIVEESGTGSNGEIACHLQAGT